MSRAPRVPDRDGGRQERERIATFLVVFFCFILTIAAATFLLVLSPLFFFSIFAVCLFIFVYALINYLIWGRPMTKDRQQSEQDN